MSPLPARPGAFAGAPVQPRREPDFLDGPAPPRAPLRPMVPARWLACRYHEGVQALGAVNREWGVDGWVPLCVRCAAAVKARTLRILSPDGEYAGRIPGGAVERIPGEELEPEDDLFE